MSEAWWYTPVIPRPRRLSQEDHKIGASLDYIEIQVAATQQDLASKIT